MSLQPQEIDRIAHLARLHLEPEQAERMRSQINGFLAIVSAMQAVDTTGVVPMAHPAEVVQSVALRLRPDLATEPNQREANQRNAPALERGLFLVPKVVE